MENRTLIEPHKHNHSHRVLLMESGLDWANHRDANMTTDSMNKSQHEDVTVMLCLHAELTRTVFGKHDRMCLSFPNQRFVFRLVHRSSALAAFIQADR